MRLRLVESATVDAGVTGVDFDELFALRQQEADAFYDVILPAGLDPQTHAISRQAYAGLLWSKQFTTTSLKTG